MTVLVVASSIFALVYASVVAWRVVVARAREADLAMHIVCLSVSAACGMVLFVWCSLTGWGRDDLGKSWLAFMSNMSAILGVRVLVWRRRRGLSP